jgi:molybdenum-dependent DNA-binding transcriptional regulator ModE
MAVFLVEPLPKGRPSAGVPTAEATFVYDHAQWATLMSAGYNEDEIAYMHGIRPTLLRPEVDKHTMSCARPRRLSDRDQTDRLEREVKRKHSPQFLSVWAKNQKLMKDEFINLCDCNVTKAADLWETSYDTAYKRVIALGMKPSSNCFDENLEQWLHDLEDAGSIAAAAHLWDVSYGTAYQRARRCNTRPQKVAEYSPKHKAERHATWKADLDRLGSVAAAQREWGISYGVALYRARQVGWTKASCAINASPCDTKWLT